jgi:two-component system, NarL family, nitrate/nitrite response regulator NarL
MNRRLAAPLVPLASPPSFSALPTTAIQGGSRIPRLANGAFPIVIIDPQTLFRRGLRLLVRQWQANATVFEAADIDQALVDMAQRPAPKILMVDADIASRRNFGGLDRLVSRLPLTPIILLAGDPDWSLAAAAVEIGARGYVPKSTSEEVLRHALSLAASGEIYPPRDFLTNCTAGNGSAAVMRPLESGSPLRKLTARQREVLSHLARGRSNKEIARCLGLLESTVKVHVRTILRKLAAANRTQAAMLAVEMGWGRRLDA